MSTPTAAKSMDEIVALCKRRGFIFPASEIYGGINGFWDYGPLGVELKNNLRDAWWHDMVRCPPAGPDNEPLEIVGLDSAIIQNPKVWEASGHIEGFNDPMVDDKETKQRFRADQLVGAAWIEFEKETLSDEEREKRIWSPKWTVVASTVGEAAEVLSSNPKHLKPFKLASNFRRSRLYPEHILQADLEDRHGKQGLIELQMIQVDRLRNQPEEIPSPYTGKTGTLTKPRMFNLMFETWYGAIKSDDYRTYLRPETAQGLFLNYKNVLDTMRVKVPFGIAQIGKAFRNEVNPRNFIYRSREFEQMEMEWFCRPEDAPKWFEFWQQQRLSWWKSLGLSDDNLTIRQHGEGELSHYAKGGAGTVDIEYRFPFTHPGFAELEGIAHRTDFDLKAHQEHAKVKLEYFDQERNERYIPHVVEPAAGLTRGVLALICEAYTPDPDRPSKVFLKFHPRLAPIQAAVFPLVAKNDMPQQAENLYQQLRKKYATRFDIKQSIGKRYARMDESGTPFCFTIDGQTLADQTVTVRDRDDCSQQRIGIAQVAGFLADRMRG
ncbi:MAG: glycine--tRNA ligase [Planctomycetes bacterium]|nr:glycine--tRNA ligase [Planctomycetota bacterium]